jgi:hypothetical protein
MLTSSHEQGLGPLRNYLFYAAAIHAALFGLGLTSSCRADLPPPLSAMSNVVSVEMDMAPAYPPSAVPGGGSPTPNQDDGKQAENSEPPPPAKAKTISQKPVHPIERPREEHAETLAPTPVVEPAETVSSGEQMAAMQAEMERRHHDMEMTAGAASGSGPGAHGGPGGPGEGGGPPAIRGSNAFGNGTHGALTGKVCFVPQGTTRIADVLACSYIATIYTDILNIPERQFRDGFPGVTGRSDWFLIDFTGAFTVRENGAYDFRLHSDDGSYLYIDDRMLIDNDGKHAPESRRGSIQLSAGQHRIKVRYAQTTDRMALQLFVRGPNGGSERLFGPQL